MFLLLCELVLFRFVLPGSDVPRNAFIDGVVRYAPSQNGTWRVRNDIAAPYAINAQGWNSGSGDYKVERTPGVMRIAVVGDSYVEALQVRHDRSLGELMAQQLSAKVGRPVEVYRFGIGGAPLSQYLHMAEREVARYRPDWIVVLVVNNDFNKSFDFVQGRYTSSFLKLKLENAQVVGEIQPTPWAPTSTDWVRHTAVARYIYYRWQVRPGRVRDLFLASARAEGDSPPARSTIPKRQNVEIATEYMIGRLSDVGKSIGARLLLATDGDRAAIYEGRGDRTPPLSRLVADQARRTGVAYLDLHPHFLTDWNRHGLPFDFQSDYHWNERGHAVSARAVADAIVRTTQN